MQKHILIVDNDPLIAGELALTVERAGGRVVGPFAYVADALRRLGSENISGAVLDIELLDRNITPVVLYLVRRAVPVVVHTASALPAELASTHPALALVSKPCPPEDVVELLFDLIHLSLGAAPADVGRAPIAGGGDDVPSLIDGYQEANQILRDVRAGSMPLRDALAWVTELRAERLEVLAAEVEKRLPTSQ